MSDQFIDVDPLGRLKWDAGLGWWESEELHVPWLEARITFALPPADESHEPTPPDAEDVDAVANFLALPSSTRESVRPHLEANLKKISELGDTPEIATPIWRAVKPMGASTTDAHYAPGKFVIVECNCDWEEEHGLQLSFQHGRRLARVSQYDGQPTDGSAYARPELDEWLVGSGGDLPIRYL